MTDEIWVAKDGRRIPVGELEVDHMRAILRMILRTARMKSMLKLQQEFFEFLDDEDKRWGKD